MFRLEGNQHKQGQAQQPHIVSCGIKSTGRAHRSLQQTAQGRRMVICAGPVIGICRDSSAVTAMLCVLRP